MLSFSTFCLSISMIMHSTGVVWTRNVSPKFYPPNTYFYKIHPLIIYNGAWYSKNSQNLTPLSLSSALASSCYDWTKIQGRMVNFSHHNLIVLQCTTGLQSFTNYWTIPWKNMLQSCIQKENTFVTHPLPVQSQFPTLLSQLRLFYTF